ncbi:unnamed protein product, partial [Iphiclides podalirius]
MYRGHIIEATKSVYAVRCEPRRLTRAWRGGACGSCGGGRCSRSRRKAAQKRAHLGPTHLHNAPAIRALAHAK